MGFSSPPQGDFLPNYDFPTIIKLYVLKFIKGRRIVEEKS